MRRPHEFKIACLQDIRALFPTEWNPFYAGFGNRDTDEVAYRWGLHLPSLHWRPLCSLWWDCPDPTAGCSLDHQSIWSGNWCVVKLLSF